ncbi:MAG: hypothetical protein J0L66_07060 [Cytophagales bacterium]|nr:hypothetical protein [Cytophagales bacterium]
MRLVSLLLVCISCHAACARSADSTSQRTLIITPRFNSAGHFPFTGSLLHRHLNFDLNIFYEKGNYGFFLFKSVDWIEPRSYINYLQPGLFRKFELTTRWQMRLFVGYLFSQTTGFIDKDSDYYTATTFYYAAHKNVRVENTTLFYDVTQSGKIANRLLIASRLKGFKIDLYLWHRWVLEQARHATSASLALSLPEWRLHRAVSLAGSVSYQGYLTSSKPEYALRNGWLFSVAFPINVNP